MCHLQFLSSAHNFSNTGLLPTLVGLFLHFVLVFDVIVNGIVSLISLSDSSLLVYRNATDLCTLILYPATLPNLLMSSSFLVASLGFSMYSMMSPANSDSITSSFPIWIPFISFYSLIAVARTSKTMLNKRGKTGHPCRVPNLRGNAFSIPV